MPQFLRHIIAGDGPGYGLLQQRLSTLPFKHGGMGVYTMQDTKHYCFLASCLQTLDLQSTILRRSGVDGNSLSFQQALESFNSLCGNVSPICAGNFATHSMNSLATIYFDAVKKNLPTNYVMSDRDSVLWKCNQTKHAWDFLLAIPSLGLNQVIGARQFSAVLQYRLGIPLFEADGACPFCKRGMDVFGDHALHCANEVGLKFRHDLVRDIIADMFFRAGVPVRKEMDLGLLADNGNALRPADIFVYNWDNGRDVCLDVTGVSPFTGGGVRSFFSSMAIKNAVTRKNTKYLEKCASQGYGFGTLAFTTLGELGDETIDFLKRLRNYIASNDANVRVGEFLFHRLGVAIQKGVEAQLVARLPTSFLSDTNPLEF